MLYGKDVASLISGVINDIERLYTIKVYIKTMKLLLLLLSYLFRIPPLVSPTPVQQPPPPLFTPLNLMQCHKNPDNPGPSLLSPSIHNSTTGWPRSNHPLSPVDTLTSLSYKYCVSQKYWPILYSKLLHKMDQYNLLDTQYLKTNCVLQNRRSVLSIRIFQGPVCSHYCMSKK